MSELEPKIKCKHCQGKFLFFHDLRLHKCACEMPDDDRLDEWLRDNDCKIKSLEAVVAEEIKPLTMEQAFEIIGLVEEEA